METFNISLPTSWEELTDKQLHLVYELFARDLSAAEVKTLCLMKWNRLVVLASLPDKRFIIKRDKVADKPNEQRKAGFIAVMAKKLRPKAKEEATLSVRQIQQATTTLDFLESLAPVPVRISKIGRHKAVAADFEKVPFEKFLFVDNLFQGYLNTQEEQLLQQIAEVLYDSDKVTPDKAQLVGVFYWMASLKQYFSTQFSNFYKPVSTQEGGNLLGYGSTDLYTKLRDNTNVQIRALTGGDITKEATILKMDTWRALTELDAKAKEAEELRKSTRNLSH